MSGSPLPTIGLRKSPALAARVLQTQEWTKNIQQITHCRTAPTYRGRGCYYTTGLLRNEMFAEEGAVAEGRAVTGGAAVAVTEGAA